MHRWIDVSSIFPVTLLVTGGGVAFGTLCPEARADSTVEIAGSTGFGVLAAGVASARFAVSPSVSFSVRGERWFFVARDTTSFLGASGGQFGLNNETALGGGLFWELVNVSAGLSLMEYTLPICGPRACARLSGVAPGASARLDVFGPYLSGGLGITADCTGTWLTGNASFIWGGVSVRCSVGPIIRFTSRR